MADEDVQAEETSAEETTSEGAEIKEEPQAQSLTEERVQQMIAEASSQAKEVGRREMQGIKDREVAEAQRRARLAESENASYKTSFTNLDEETQTQIELARLRGRDQYYQTFEQQETQRQQQEAYFRRLDEASKEHLTALGIDPEDKRIDWARDEPDYISGRSKFDASIARIVSEEKKVTDKEKTNLDELRASLKAEIYKELGYDSVDTSISSGGEGGGSPDKIIEAYGDGKVTREQYEKAMKQKGLSP